MVCIVVSRNGEGDVWLHASLPEARLHPVPQIDDVYAETPEALVDQYGRSHVDGLLRFAEGRDRSTLVSAIEEWRASRRDAPLVPSARMLLLEKVKAAARRPLSDPAEIVRTIVEDRRAREGRVLRSIPDVLDRSSVLAFDRKPTGGGRVRTETEENTDMGEKRDVFRMKDADVISFGKDPDGKQYSSEHTPKRGDNTKALWGKYRDGMTVKEALDAGLSRSNIRRDRRAGNIVITPTAVEENADQENADQEAA